MSITAVSAKRSFVTNKAHEYFLELRYLCMKTWEQIGVDLGYNVRHVRRLRDIIKAFRHSGLL